jgi:alpha-1,3-rhamnosyl/mannosyltransferase
MTNPAPTALLYDARTVRPGMSGVGRYTLNLLAALVALPSPPRIRALFLKDSLPLARRDPALAGVECLEAPASHEAHPVGDLWLRYGVRRMIRPGEIYHGPAFIIPGGAQPFARVATVHDLFVFTHPRFYSFKFRTWLRWATARACRFADRVIVPTETVREEIIRRGLAPAAKVAAIAEAPDATAALWDAPERETKNERENEQKRKKKTLIQTRFADGARARFVTVGTLDPRKDPATARAALVELHGLPGGRDERGAENGGAAWLWIGGAGPIADDTTEDLKAKAEALGFEWIGHAPAGVLHSALERATAYVTCSRTEGFGIPLVEALAAGCPIVASDIPVHREVAGDAALYFKAGDARALAQALARMMNSEELRRDLIAHGRARSGQFTWRAAAERTMEVYQQAWRE